MKKYKLKKEIMPDSVAYVVCGLRARGVSVLLLLTVKLFVCVRCMEMNSGRNVDVTTDWMNRTVQR